MPTAECAIPAAFGTGLVMLTARISESARAPRRRPRRVPRDPDQGNSRGRAAPGARAPRRAGREAAPATEIAPRRSSRGLTGEQLPDPPNQVGREATVAPPDERQVGGAASEALREGAVTESEQDPRLFGEPSAYWRS